MSLRSTFLQAQGSLAVRERKTYIAGLVAATAVVTEVLKPYAGEGHYDASKCEDRSSDFFGLGIRLLLYPFGYVSTEEPVTQK
ncbi:hypothetical protein N7530_003148 [Penicillium desertorum]|uniref:Uncharacterized protein n=1 Tax=Penicillium desertorum TaxID=1303715 RepID=A0A9W9WVS5_9EURO|nr:hypothetical protein N7530_003148 [Penicillium desertorum]